MTTKTITSKYFYISLGSIIIIDLISKYVASIYINSKINVIGELLFLKYASNPGIAFSFYLPALKIITILLIIAIFYYYFKEEKVKGNKLIDVAFGLVLGGAIGNGIERVLYGEVIDFIGIKGFSIFNIADISIIVGAIIYFVYLFKTKK